MSSGKNALLEMDQRINAQRAEADRVARRLDALLSMQEHARAEVATGTERLARLRVDLLRDGQAGTALDAADRQVMALLEKRHLAFVELDQKIAGSGTRQDTLAKTRLDAVILRDRALAAERTLYVKTAESARTTPEWMAASALVQSLEHHVAAGEKKCLTAESDQAEKRRPYEADRLFVYLWTRRYGFPEYDAMPLIRTMDGWVARLCRYDGAHRNYRMLLALAPNLRAHVAALQTKLAAAKSALAEVERVTLERAGYAARQQARADAEAALLDAEKALAREEQSHQLNLGLRATYADGTDPFTQEAVRMLTAHMGREDLDTLRNDARATTTPKDDALVAGLANARAKISQHVLEIDQLKSQQDLLIRKLADADELRRRFRSNAYDSNDSEFGNGIVIGAVLGQVLSGALDLNRAWEQVHNNHRFRLPQGHSGGWGGGSDHSGGFGSVFGGSGDSGGSSGGDSDSGFSTDSSFGDSDGGFSTDDSF